MMGVSSVSILYATLAAAFFGGQVVLTMRSLAYVEPQVSSMLSIGTCVVLFWFFAPLLLRAEYWLNPGLYIFMASGLIHPIFSTFLSFEATKRMGATVSATISSISPLFATIGAVFTLGEDLTLSLLVGTLATVVGIMVLSWRRQGPTIWARWALLLPVGAAVIRAGNNILGKLGLKMLPSPYFASLVSFTVSFAGALLIYRYRLGRSRVNLPRQSLMWSGLAGLSIALGVLSMYAALSAGLVVVVSPVISTFPLFTFVLSLLFRQEAFKKNMLFGILLVVGGVIWISIQ